MKKLLSFKNLYPSSAKISHNQLNNERFSYLKQFFNESENDLYVLNQYDRNESTKLWTTSKRKIKRITSCIN